jgi:hypothetical protein
MLLSVQERLLLAQTVLPKEGDIVTLQLVRKLTGELLLTDKEVTDFGIEQTSDGMRWNPANTTDKEIEIGDATKTIIVEALKRMSDAKQLPMDAVSLYEKFVLASETATE